MVTASKCRTKSIQRNAKTAKRKYKRKEEKNYVQEHKKEIEEQKTTNEETKPARIHEQRELEAVSIRQIKWEEK